MSADAQEEDQLYPGSHSRRLMESKGAAEEGEEVLEPGEQYSQTLSRPQQELSGLFLYF